MLETIAYITILVVGLGFIALARKEYECVIKSGKDIEICGTICCLDCLAYEQCDRIGKACDLTPTSCGYAKRG